MKNLWHVFEMGGPVMWPLLAASIAGLALIFDRAWAFFCWRQDFAGFVGELAPVVTRGAWDEALALCRRKGIYAHVAGCYLAYGSAKRRLRDDAVRREGNIVVGLLDRGLRWLAMLAQASTLLGLLGTFHVMIARFNDQTGGTTGNFTTAIWEALLTTMFGLVIAIPCSVAYQLFEAQLDRITRQMDILVSYLDEWRHEALASRDTQGPTDAGTET